jgi:hypothetical protein
VDDVALWAAANLLSLRNDDEEKIIEHLQNADNSVEVDLVSCIHRHKFGLLVLLGLESDGDHALAVRLIRFGLEE